MRSDRGTYALVLYCPKAALVQVGRLGQLQLEVGFYVYAGSALGPGGVRARIAYHKKLPGHPHWHIDYLKAHTHLHQIWYAYGVRPHEHHWAHAIKRLRGASLPLAGFGSSDCHCESHLYFFLSGPSRSDFQRRLRGRPKTLMSLHLHSTPRREGNKTFRNRPLPS